MKKFLLFILLSIIPLMAIAEIKDQSTKELRFEWEFMSDKNAFVSSEHFRFMVTLSTNTVNEYNIYIQPLNLFKMKGTCNKQEQTKQSTSVSFNGVLIKMGAQCIDSTDNDNTKTILLFPVTDEGSAFVINQFKKSAYVTIEDSGGMFSDTVSAKGFLKIFNKLNSNKGTYNGL